MFFSLRLASTCSMLDQCVGKIGRTFSMFRGLCDMTVAPTSVGRCVVGDN